MKRALALFALLAGCADPSLPADELPLSGHRTARIEFRDLFYPPNAVAMSYVDDRGNRIDIDPERWQRMPAEVRWFTLAHELCHLELTDETELEADCCAVSRLGRRDLVELVQWYPAERGVVILECAE